MDEKIVVVGSGKLSVQIAEDLMKHGFKTAVYEKSISGVSSVKKMCESKGILYQSMDVKTMTEKIISDLNKYSLKVISAINSYVFPREVTLHKNFTGVNYHNSLLPDHKGMNAEAWAIYDMDECTGITWHKILPEIDGGEIIAQKKIKMDESVNSLRLLKIQANLAYDSFLEFAPSFITGNDLKSVSQNFSSKKMHKIKDVPNNGFIDKKWSLKKTLAFLRAMDYGKLYTLGHPMIRLDSKIYVWDRYKTVDDLPPKNDYTKFQNGNIIIGKKGLAKKIYLINAQIQN